MSFKSATSITFHLVFNENSVLIHYFHFLKPPKAFNCLNVFMIGRAPSHVLIFLILIAGILNVVSRSCVCPYLTCRKIPNLVSPSPGRCDLNFDSRGNGLIISLVCVRTDDLTVRHQDQGSRWYTAELTQMKSCLELLLLSISRNRFVLYRGNSNGFYGRHPFWAGRDPLKGHNSWTPLRKRLTNHLGYPRLLYCLTSFLMLSLLR